ncbi:MAG: hypothetical protein P8105_02520 [Dehalococcoidia bacterium]
MGDIRSSWEIAQEKADRLGDLSSEERNRQKEELYRNTAAVLVHQYLDDKDIRPVKKELNKYTGEVRKLKERILLDELINVIDLDKQESLDIAVNGIEALWGKQETGHDIEPVKHLYAEYYKIRNEEKRRVDDAGRQILRDMDISGSAIGTINIYARDEWLNALNSLTACFKKWLKGLQEDIVQ